MLNEAPVYRMLESDSEDIRRELPVRHERVIVITPLFQCLGYLDADGLWRSYYGNRVIESVTGWLPLESSPALFR